MKAKNSDWPEAFVAVLPIAVLIAPPPERMCEVSTQDRWTTPKDDEASRFTHWARFYLPALGDGDHWQRQTPLDWQARRGLDQQGGRKHFRLTDFSFLLPSHWSMIHHAARDLKCGQARGADFDWHTPLFQLPRGNAHASDKARLTPSRRRSFQWAAGNFQEPCEPSYRTGVGCQEILDKKS